VLDESLALSATADALAELDVLAGWAVLAREWDYCRPDLDDGDALTIADGRHPVVEQMMKVERLGLAGSYHLRPQRHRAIRHGGADPAHHRPQHGRKSTYIRQVALIHAHGPSRLLGAGQGLPRRPRGPHFLPRGRERRPRPGQLDLHGRDERDGQHPEQRRPTGR